MNWINEAFAAAKTLALHFAGVIDLNRVFDEMDNDLLYSHLWSTKLSGGQWGQYAFVALSPDEKSLYVMVNEYQPWGTGMEEPHTVATLPVSELSKAIQFALAVMETDFELYGLMEDEESGRYVPAPSRLPDVTNLLAEQAIGSH